MESLKKENLGVSFSKMETRKKSKFSAFEEYFQKQDARRIVLSFSKIEEILGYPLCSSAYLYESYWYKKESGSIRRTCFQCGYVIKKVELKKKKLVFEQDCERRLSLPTNAKLEWITLQKYIEKKYGITKDKRKKHKIYFIMLLEKQKKKVQYINDRYRKEKNHKQRENIK